MEKETLEEAAEKYCLINNIPIDQMIVKNDRSCEFKTPITMFIEGAKHMAERMYNEEDMIEFAKYCKAQNSKYPGKFTFIENYLKEFKNKKNILKKYLLQVI